MIPYRFVSISSQKGYFLRCLVYIHGYFHHHAFRQLQSTFSYFSVHILQLADPSPKGCAVALVGDKCEVHLHIKVSQLYLLEKSRQLLIC